ncbi:hypothetical protein BDV26DRAFT_299251 [Aspergillus bertholletiae]|uniref:Uncharacterized protein n=1 Tax=Aspergillus bertholletiae TaxID=1226010 RepID=A0A5N7AMQ0_9EURO|nr:hypothetical protein BDV26DRAFT_299251 [Aspergillus bertholletiae]
MDADSVVKHVQPWQQIVVFITRTQLAQEGKHPVYGMTPRQRKKWRQLWQTAQTAQAVQAVQAAQAAQAVETVQAGLTRAHSPDPMDENRDEDVHRDRDNKDPIQQWRMSEIE